MAAGTGTGSVQHVCDPYGCDSHPSPGPVSFGVNPSPGSGAGVDPGSDLGTDTGGAAPRSGAAGTGDAILAELFGQRGPDGGTDHGLGRPGDHGRGLDKPSDVVPDVAGRDIKTWKRGGPDPTRGQLQERLSRQAHDSGEFEPVTFEAFVKKAVIVPGGEVEITLSVPKELKYAAIPLTDAAGFMVTIHAERTIRE